VTRRQGWTKSTPAGAVATGPRPRSMRALLPILSVAVGAAVRLAAPNSVTGIRPLAFGTVFPGVPRVVSRTDPVNSGQFNLTGKKNRNVLLTFTLPATMAGPAGATMPLVFGATDAGYSASQSVGNQVAFDPRLPHTVTLSNSGAGSVFLGGRVNPAANQRAGGYTGTVTLTVVFL
jgi:uncharacterized protein DUF4402